MSMYVRVKRQRQTMFLHCEPTDTILSLKRKIQAIVDRETEDQRLVGIEEKIVYDEGKTLRECKVEDGGVIALVFKKTADEKGNVEWEEVDIKSPDDAPADEESKK